IVMGAILLFALIASVYLVYVLEIFKFKLLRGVQLRRVDPDTSEHDIVASVERDIETGEFDAIKQPEPPE
ncbi:MAG: undecaprenyl/decaprenyl-phosphate alpha-N-acetylglucosaminyl 1-phosphate transferase, partial [Solirubrobacteraceae bacterium]